MPVDGRGPLKLMGLFPLMFSSVEKEFRNLSKTLRWRFYISADMLWGRRVGGGGTRNQPRRCQLAGQCPDFWKCEHTETIRRGQSDRPGCSSTSFLHPRTFSGRELPCAVYLLHQLATKSSFCETHIHKHILSYPKGVFYWAVLNIKIIYNTCSVPNFPP